MNITKPISGEMTAYKKNEYIRLDVADNGFLVGWETCTPSTKISDSRYEDHKEVYQFAEAKKAVAKLVSLHRENMVWRKEASLKKEESSSLESAVANMTMALAMLSDSDGD